MREVTKLELETVVVIMESTTTDWRREEEYERKEALPVCLSLSSSLVEQVEGFGRQIRSGFRRKLARREAFN